MKHLIVILALFLLLSSCHSGISDTGQIPTGVQDSIFDPYLVLTKGLPKPIVEELPWASTCMVIDTPYMAIGKLIDTTQTFAISCVNINADSARLIVSQLDSDHWSRIGDYIVPFYVIFIDYNDAGRHKPSNAILLSGPPNMNGNMQKWYYVYNPRTRAIQSAGGFFSNDYTIDTANSTIQVTYEGSWYMDTWKALYIWHQDSLVELRSVDLSIIDQAKFWKGISNNRIEYSVNKDTSYSGGIATVFSEVDDENSERHKKYWDGFFDLK